jgi:hypothetical protein
MLRKQVTCGQRLGTASGIRLRALDLRARPSTLPAQWISTGFLNRVSEVRFLPGAPIHTVVQKADTRKTRLDVATIRPNLSHDGLYQALRLGSAPSISSSSSASSVGSERWSARLPATRL